MAYANDNRAAGDVISRPAKVNSLQAIMRLRPKPNSKYCVFAFALNRDMLKPDGSLDELHAMVFPLGGFDDETDAEKHAKNVIAITGHPGVISAPYGSPVPLTTKFDPKHVVEVAVDAKGRVIELESAQYKHEREEYEKRLKQEREIMAEAENETDPNHIEHFKRQCYLAIKNRSSFQVHSREAASAWENYKKREMAVRDHYARYPEHEAKWLPYLKEKLIERGELNLYKGLKAAYKEIRDELLGLIDEDDDDEHPEPVVESVQPTVSQPIVDIIQPTVSQPIVDIIQPTVSQPIVDIIQPTVVSQPVVDPVINVVQSVIEHVVDVVQPTVVNPTIESITEPEIISPAVKSCKRPVDCVPDGIPCECPNMICTGTPDKEVAQEELSDDDCPGGICMAEPILIDPSPVKSLPIKSSVTKLSVIKLEEGDEDDMIAAPIPINPTPVKSSVIKVEEGDEDDMIAADDVMTPIAENVSESTIEHATEGKLPEEADNPGFVDEPEEELPSPKVVIPTLSQPKVMIPTLPQKNTLPIPASSVPKSPSPTCQIKIPTMSLPGAAKSNPRSRK